MHKGAGGGFEGSSAAHLRPSNTSSDGASSFGLVNGLVEGWASTVGAGLTTAVAAAASAALRAALSGGRGTGARGDRGGGGSEDRDWGPVAGEGERGVVGGAASWVAAGRRAVTAAGERTAGGSGAVGDGGTAGGGGASAGWMAEGGTEAVVEAIGCAAVTPNGGARRGSSPCTAEYIHRNAPAPIPPSTMSDPRTIRGEAPDGRRKCASLGQDSGRSRDSFGSAGSGVSSLARPPVSSTRSMRKHDRRATSVPNGARARAS